MYVLLLHPGKKNTWKCLPFRKWLQNQGCHSKLNNIFSHKFYRPLCVVLYSPWTSCIVPYPGLTCSCPSGWRVIGLFFPSPAIPLLNVLCLSGLLGLGLPGKAQGVLVPSSRGTSGELEWEFPWCLSAHPIRRPGPLWRRKTCMPSIRVISNESPLRMRWPKYWSFILRVLLIIKYLLRREAKH